MSKETKKSASPAFKLTVLKSHFLEKAPISDLAEKNNLHPSSIYNWAQHLFTHGAIAFERRNDQVTGSGAVARLQKRINELEAKLTQKNELVAELLEEHVKLKKELGVI